MGNRCERHRQKKLARRLILSMFILAIISYGISMWIWKIKFYEFNPSNFIFWSQCYYSIALFLFIAFAIPDSKAIIIILKCLFKIAFNVWIISFVLLSSFGSYEQNIFLIFISIITGYFETLIEILDYVNLKIMNLKINKLNLLNKDSLRLISIPISIIIISLIHIIVAFVASDFTKQMVFPK